MEASHAYALVMNYPERDRRVNQRIADALLRLSPAAQVYLLERRDPQLLSRLMHIKPRVILTCPLTAAGMAPDYYLYKLLLDCFLVCFRTEGVLNITSDSQVKEMAGLEQYGSSLIDYEIFWGSRTAGAVGRHLVSQGKIAGVDRLLHFGTPYFEDYLSARAESEPVPEEVARRLNGRHPSRVVLSVTGFHLADYTPQDVLAAGDLVDRQGSDANEEFAWVQETVVKIKRFRQGWIDTFRQCAMRHPDLIFIIKLHPMEVVNYAERGIAPYAALEGQPNIILVREPVPIKPLLDRAGILFHYGSTTMLEAYLCRLPTVYVKDGTLSLGTRKLYELDDNGIPSTMSVDLADVSSVVDRYAAGPIAFACDARVDTYLAEVLDIHRGQPYRPAEKIARFLIDHLPPHPMQLRADDPHLLKALSARKPLLMRLIHQMAGIGDPTGSSDRRNPGLERLSKIVHEVLQAGPPAPDEGRPPEPNQTSNGQQTFMVETTTSASANADCPQSGIGPLLHRLPKTFMVETVLGCNLRCPECALGAGLISRPKALMPLDHFKTITQKIRPYCQYLYLHIWGEPMLHPDIFRIIKHASAFTKTNISTNAVCLNMEKAERLILSGVTDVIVSIDGFSQPVYEQYRLGGNVEKALTMLKHMALCNARHGRPVNIQPQFIVFAHNQHERQAFEQFCREIGLKAAFKAPYIRPGSRYRKADAPQYHRPTYTDLPSLKKAMRQCNDPREVMTVLVDGTCVMCCYDHNATTHYGNLLEKSVPEIWNDPAYHRDRQAIIEGHPPAYCLDHCLQWTLAPEAAAKALPKQTNGTNPSAAPEQESNSWGRRRPYRPGIKDPAAALDHARDCFRSQRFNDAFDVYEALAVAYPNQAVQVLAEIYDQYQKLPTQDRYTLYQSRHYDFGIRPGDKVLDIGSGNIPFTLATHLADISINDHHYGRAGQPFKTVDGKPVYECNLEHLQFSDKEFDFIYCSHVLEHVDNPESACKELIRVGKRGFIETPTRGKDIWLNTARMSNHRWHVHRWGEKLIFNQYLPIEINGFQTTLLLNMHVSPQSLREKAFSALLYLKADLVNTMLLWENTFSYEVHRIDGGIRQETAQ